MGLICVGDKRLRMSPEFKELERRREKWRGSWRSGDCHAGRPLSFGLGMVIPSTASGDSSGVLDQVSLSFLRPGGLNNGP